MPQSTTNCMSHHTAFIPLAKSLIPSAQLQCCNEHHRSREFKPLIWKSKKEKEAPESLVDHYESNLFPIVERHPL